MKKKKVTNEKCKNQTLMVWGCISAHGMCDLHMCKATIDAKAYV